MSWTDKISDAWNWIKDTATPAIGGAWELSKDFFSEEFGGISDAFSQTSSGASYGLNTVQRGTATALLNDPTQLGVGTLFSTDHWNKAWNLTDVHDVGGGQQAEGISPGQIFSMPIADLGVKDLNDSPEAAQKRFDYFHNSWSGKLQSGAVDLAFGIFADPLVMVGKSAKGFEIGRAAIAPESVPDIMAVASGAKAATEVAPRVAKDADDVDKFLSWTAKHTPAEIAAHPALADKDAGGTIAYLMHRADVGQFTDGTRDGSYSAMATKRTVFGALLGDDASIQKLKTSRQLLANDLRQITQTPIQSLSEARFNPYDGGWSVLQDANKADAPEVLAQAKEITDEMARLDRVISGAGAPDATIRGTIAQNRAFQGQLSKLQSSTLYGGIGNRPVTVVTGILGNRLSNHISLRDPVAGYDQLKATLNQSPYLSGDDRNALLSGWLGAVSDGDRANIVRKAEEGILRRTAEHYNIPKDQIETIMALGDKRRNAAQSLLKSRLYSASPVENYVHYVDPESGTITVIGKPLLQSQIEDFQHIVNPRAVDQTMKAGSQNRLFEQMTSYFSNPATLEGAANLNAVTDMYTKLDAFGDVVKSGLQKVTNLWKDGILLGRAPAFAVRNQIDAQMRLMAHTGVLHTFAGLKQTLPSMASYYKARAAGLSDEDALIKAIAPQFEDLGFTEDEVGKTIRMISSNGGSYSDLVSGLADKAVDKMRSTGDWGYVDGKDRLWRQAWDRGVTKQIRNSPTAMRFVAGASHDDALNWVMSNPDGLKEWNQVANAYDGHDVERWLSEVEGHVKHMLPTAELRNYAMKQEPRKTVDDYFSQNLGENKMRVHGESYSPLSVNKEQSWYQKGRQNLYKLAADAPENVMARTPLYLHDFKANLAEIQDRLLAGSGRTSLTQEEMMNARRQADHLARRSIGKYLFDSSDTSNLAHHMRFVSPFFGAWEDMIKKWGTLFYENPAYGERLREAWDSPANAGLQSDEYGNRIDARGRHFDKDGNLVTNPALIGQRDMITVPLGFIPKSWRDAAGIGSNFKFDKKSFNIAFQGDPWWLPGFGPLVGIPANEIITRAYPEAASNPIIATLLPYGTTNGSIPRQLLPAWARHYANAFPSIFGTTDEWREQVGLELRQEFIDFQQGKIDDPRLHMDRVTSRVRNRFLLRGILGQTAPVTITPDNEMQFYLDQAHTYSQKFGNVQQDPNYQNLLKSYENKYGQNGRDRLVYEHPEYQDWMTRFGKDYPGYFDLAVSLSTNDSGLVATNQAVTAYKKYRKAISLHPEYAWMIAGEDNAYGLTPDTQFSQAAHNFELGTASAPGSKTNLRNYDDPAKALEAAEVSRGWSSYQIARTKLNIAMEKAGITSLNQTGAEDLKQGWDQYIKDAQSYNQYWAKDYLSRDDGTALNIMNAALDAIKAQPELAKTGPMIAMQDYIASRRKLQQVLIQRGTGGLNAKANEDLDASWGAYVQRLRQSSPGFEQIWNRGLDKDLANTEVRK